MSKLKWSSFFQTALFGFLAMICISCAHQSQIEPSLLSEEESATTDAMTANNNPTSQAEAQVGSQEATPQEMAQQDSAAPSSVGTEQTPSEDASKVAAELSTGQSELTSQTSQTEAEKAELEKGALDNSSVANSNLPESVPTPVTTARVEEPMIKKDESYQPSAPEINEPNREVASESDSNSNSVGNVSGQEASSALSPTPEATIATPGEVKTESGAQPASRKKSLRKKHSSQKNKEVLPIQRAEATVPQTKTSPQEVIASTAPVVPVAPVVAVKEEPTVMPVEKMMPEKVEVKPSKPLVAKNPSSRKVAVNDDEEGSPRLASLEIATFVTRHWVLLLIMGTCLVAGLYLFLKRKNQEDSQVF